MPIYFDDLSEIKHDGGYTPQSMTKGKNRSLPSKESTSGNTNVTISGTPLSQMKDCLVRVKIDSDGLVTVLDVFDPAANRSYALTPL